MASINLKKADKLHAQEQMLRDRFTNEYNLLMRRRRDMIQRIYNETFGEVGWHMQAIAGAQRDTWLDYRSKMVAPDLAVPQIIVDSGKRQSQMHDGTQSLFTGTGNPGSLERYDRFAQKLPSPVPWPAKGFSSKINIPDTATDLHEDAAQLNETINEFNDRAGTFEQEAYDTLMKIRTSKQVDQMFPELWRYLPAGVRERGHQGVATIDQNRIDQLRNQLNIA